MSRLSMGIALGFALVITTGCGSKPAPTQPTATTTEPESPPEPTTPKVAWEPNADKHVVPAAPVTGSIGGAEVTPEVLIENNEMIFRVVKSGTKVAERSVTLKFPRDQTIMGKNWKVKNDPTPGPSVPEVWLEIPGKPITTQESYALTLELSPRKDSKVTGKIYLSLPDPDKTTLAGTFAVSAIRPHTERPGPDDAPYVSGEVTVIGAKPDAKVRVAYAAFFPTVVVAKEVESPFDPQPESLAGWILDDNDKPRNSTLIPGDGATRPFRYEHVKLPPGRYLLTATIVDSGAVWKWVDVPANGTLTENFTLDASKTGSLEVTVPIGATGKVLIAPADEPTRPPLDPAHVESLTLQMLRKDVEVVAGKAIVKNLGVGKYEVRFGDERRMVEIVTGKTAELNITPPKK